jgi:hypothetical protein
MMAPYYQPGLGRISNLEKKSKQECCYIIFGVDSPVMTAEVMYVNEKQKGILATIKLVRKPSIPKYLHPLTFTDHI